MWEGVGGTCTPAARRSTRRTSFNRDARIDPTVVKVRLLALGPLGPAAHWDALGPFWQGAEMRQISVKLINNHTHGSITIEIVNLKSTTVFFFRKIFQ